MDSNCLPKEIHPFKKVISHSYILFIIGRRNLDMIQNRDDGYEEIHPHDENQNQRGQVNEEEQLAANEQQPIYR